jgi:CubicO group peptidase (beta-lactamase class C family)
MARARWRGSALALVLLLFVAAPREVRAQKAPLTGLDAYIQKAMHDWGVVGLAIAVVKDDSVVFEKGYGVRRVGESAPVDAHTLFAIGSNTKLFTAVAAGTLVDQGKLHWDDGVTQYLPWFQLYDVYASREMTVGDLLAHHSGLGRRGDLLWYGSAYDRDEVIRRIRYLKPNSSFRSQYGYQNIMVLTAGQVVAAVAGRRWDDVVKDRIFGPLSMTETNTSVKDLQGVADVASPHLVMPDSAPVAVPWRNIDNVGPAGSINSSVHDMAQWLRMLLGDGEYGGKQLIKPETLREIESPHTIIPLPPDTMMPSRHFVDYGYGIVVQDYRGVKVLWHTGGIDGMLSLVGFIPERHVGLVVLTNTQGHNDLFTALLWRVFDADLGAPPRDWSSILLAQTRKQEAAERAAEQKRDSARVKGTQPSLPLDHYVGTYRNEMYGDATVSMDDGHLVVRYGPAFTGDLEPWQYDTFRAHWRDITEGQAFVTFTLDDRGRVASMDAEGMATFDRVPEKGGTP